MYCYQIGQVPRLILVPLLHDLSEAARLVRGAVVLLPEGQMQAMAAVQGVGLKSFSTCQG